MDQIQKKIKKEKNREPMNIELFNNLFTAGTQYKKENPDNNKEFKYHLLAEIAEKYMLNKKREDDLYLFDSADEISDDETEEFQDEDENDAPVVLFDLTLFSTTFKKKKYHEYNNKTKIALLILSQLPDCDTKEVYEQYIVQNYKTIRSHIKSLDDMLQYSLLQLVKNKNITIFQFFIYILSHSAEETFKSSYWNISIDFLIEKEIGKEFTIIKQKKNMIQADPTSKHQTFEEIKELFRPKNEKNISPTINTSSNEELTENIDLDTEFDKEKIKQIEKIINNIKKPEYKKITDMLSSCIPKNSILSEEKQNIFAKDFRHKISIALKEIESIDKTIIKKIQELVENKEVQMIHFLFYYANVHSYPPLIITKTKEIIKLKKCKDILDHIEIYIHNNPHTEEKNNEALLKLFNKKACEELKTLTTIDDKIIKYIERLVENHNEEMIDFLFSGISDSSITSRSIINKTKEIINRQKCDYIINKIGPWLQKNPKIHNEYQNEYLEEFNTITLVLLYDVIANDEKIIKTIKKLVRQNNEEMIDFLFSGISDSSIYSRSIINKTKEIINRQKCDYIINKTTSSIQKNPEIDDVYYNEYLEEFKEKLLLILNNIISIENKAITNIKQLLEKDNKKMIDFLFLSVSDPSIASSSIITRAWLLTNNKFCK